MTQIGWILNRQDG